MTFTGVMLRLTPRQALLAACLVSGLLTAACASVAPAPYVDQAAIAPVMSAEKPAPQFAAHRP